MELIKKAHLGFFVAGMALIALPVTVLLSMQSQDVRQRAAVLPAERGTDLDVPGVDLTIYRTVNTLSCHPQNPLMHELPLYILHDPNALPKNQPNDILPAIKDRFIRQGQKGYCVGVHAQADPNVVGKNVGQMDHTGEYQRPKIPYRHYLVYEFPNPAYCDRALDPTCTPSKFSGRYIHWEGFTKIFEIAVGSGGEVWYPKDRIGGMAIGQSKMPTYPEIIGQKDGQNIWGSYVINNSNFYWQTCAGGAGTLRPGDEGLPCFTFNVNGANHIFNGQLVEKIWNNPANFYNIPHTVKGKPLNYPTAQNWITSDTWVRCKDQLLSTYQTPYSDYISTYNSHIMTNADPAIIAKTPAPKVFPVTPPGCDYEAFSYTIDPGRKPTIAEATTAVAGGSAPIVTPPVATPTQTLLPTPTSVPTPTNTPVATPTQSTAQADSTPPVTTITSPYNGYIYGATAQTTTINAKATDTSGLSDLKILIDGVVVKVCTNPLSNSVCSYYWNTLGTASKGTHSITAISTDKATPTPNTSNTTITVTKN